MPSRVGTGCTAAPRVTSVMRLVQDTSVLVKRRDELRIEKGCFFCQVSWMTCQNDHNYIFNIIEIIKTLLCWPCSLACSYGLFVSLLIHRLVHRRHVVLLLSYLFSVVLPAGWSFSPAPSRCMLTWFTWWSTWWFILLHLHGWPDTFVCSHGSPPSSRHLAAGSLSLSSGSLVSLGQSQ